MPREYEIGQSPEALIRRIERLEARVAELEKPSRCATCGLPVCPGINLTTGKCPPNHCHPTEGHARSASGGSHGG